MPRASAETGAQLWARLRERQPAAFLGRSADSTVTRWGATDSALAVPKRGFDVPEACATRVAQTPVLGTRHSLNSEWVAKCRRGACHGVGGVSSTLRSELDADALRAPGSPSNTSRFLQVCAPQIGTLAAFAFERSATGVVRVAGDKQEDGANSHELDDTAAANRHDRLRRRCLGAASSNCLGHRLAKSRLREIPTFTFGSANPPDNADLVIKISTGSGTLPREKVQRGNPAAEAPAGFIGIDAYEAASGAGIWHGSAFAEIDPEHIDERLLSRGIEDMLASFPARNR